MTPIRTPTGPDDVIAAAGRARAAAVLLRQATTDRKNAALTAIATQLDKDRATIVAANQQDVAAAQQAGTAAGLVDRLTLTDDRLTAIIEAIDTVVALPDPVGEVVGVTDFRTVSESSRSGSPWAWSG